VKTVAGALRSICKDLKLAGEDEMADKVLCALAALTNTKRPKADLSYSYVMRKLRKNNEDKVREFQIDFKQAFEAALDQDLENPEDVALMQALKKIGVEIS
jgi:hypothetical protein